MIEPLRQKLLDELPTKFPEPRRLSLCFGGMASYDWHIGSRVQSPYDETKYKSPSSAGPFPYSLKQFTKLDNLFITLKEDILNKINIFISAEAIFDTLPAGRPLNRIFFSLAREDGQCERILVVKGTEKLDRYKNVRFTVHESGKFLHASSLTKRMVSGREILMMGYPLGLDEYDTYWPFRRNPGSGF